MYKKIILVDGSALLYRSFYGLAPLKTTAGIATHAIFGFLRSLNKCINTFKPTHVCIAWDSLRSIRKEEYNLYKANRQTIPDDLATQKTYLDKIITKLDIKQLSQVGYEADDIIFSLQKHIINNYNDCEVIIVSPDKDLLQLAKHHILIYDPFKNITLTKDLATEKLGFEPEKLLFFHSLVGDTSDNIPGVAGIGKISATSLVQNFESLQSLYQNLDKVSSLKIRKALENGKKDALLSQELFTLREIPNFSISLDNTLCGNIDFYKAKDLLIELELQSLIPDKQFLQATQYLPPDFKVTVIKTETELLFIEKSILSKAKSIAIDLETTGLEWFKDTIVGISFAFDDRETFYIPIAHTNTTIAGETFDQLQLYQVKPFLEKIIKSPSITKIFHNQKFDMHFLKETFQFSFDNTQFFDTAIAARLCLPEWIRVGLKSLSKSELNLERPDLSTILKQYGPDFRYLPIEVASEYAGLDAMQTFKLHKIFSERLENQLLLSKIFWDIEQPLVLILLKMEHLGICIDSQQVEILEQEISTELLKTIDKIHAILKSLSFPDSFIASLNLNSPKQLQSFLFETLKLPFKKKSNTGQLSTDVEVLQELAEIHPIPTLILNYRKLAKLKSTYIDALKSFKNPKTNAIHTQYSQIVVATGRLSSLEPNLQNIPQASETLNIKKCFVARPKMQLISADYSQIELRVLAELCKDTNLISAFKNGEDIHLKTATFIFNKNSVDITDADRSIAKKINFSLLYGLSSYSLSKDLKITPKEASAYIDGFFQAYPAVQPWIEASLTKAKQTGFIETILGRKRWFQHLNDNNKNIAKAESRSAINAIIQGSAAELFKIAMISIDKALTKNANILLQVHDEVLVECYEKDTPSLLHTLNNVMTSVVDWDVPLIVNFKTGFNWGSMSKINNQI